MRASVCTYDCVHRFRLVEGAAFNGSNARVFDFALIYITLARGVEFIAIVVTCARGLCIHVC